MMWTLLRAPNRKGAIFGFQRRVWCPKCTPASSSWRMVKLGIAIGAVFLFRLSRRGTLHPDIRTPERRAAYDADRRGSRVRVWGATMAPWGAVSTGFAADLQARSWLCWVA